MVDPVTAFEDWLTRNLPIIAGLIIGTAAKYGLTLTEGRKLTWRGVMIDMLLLGMLCLLAIIIADGCQLTGNSRVLVGALSAVSSDRLVRLVRDRFLKKVETDLSVSAKASSGSVVRVPAGVGEPSDMTVQPGAADTDRARTGAALKSAFRAPTREKLPSDQGDALRQLGDDL